MEALSSLQDATLQAALICIDTEDLCTTSVALDAIIPLVDVGYRCPQKGLWRHPLDTASRVSYFMQLLQKISTPESTGHVLLSLFSYVVAAPRSCRKPLSEDGAFFPACLVRHYARPCRERVSTGGSRR